MTDKRSKRRVLMIGLDGCEWTLAERLMAEGRLPATQRLAAKSARVKLDHGGARRTGLAWEHVSTGLSPEDAERWAAVDFDPNTYAARQRATNLDPFVAGLGVRTVVVDPPYFDLGKTAAQGLVGWGAHDPGVATASRPTALLEEVKTRFGEYCAREWIYGFVWPSPSRAAQMADQLPRAVDQRCALAQWMLCERFSDWELGYVVVSEYHSAVEALWHGVDETHPLHGLPSAAAARRGIESVYEAGDRLIGALMDAFPDAVLVVFNLHGMGPNNSDNGSMALLPELLYRREFARPLMRARKWTTTETGVPVLGEHQLWRREIARLYANPLQLAMRRAFGAKAKSAGQPSLDWMPASRYRPFWPRMRAFALPSFYDGRIRVNLKGREANGLVEREQYDEICADYINFLGACRDPISGAPAIERVERHTRDPYALNQSEPDLVVIWSKAAPLGLFHEDVGTIGPLPYRRTGGHTGGDGFAFFHGAEPCDQGVKSAFDIVPTVLRLLAIEPERRFSGKALELSV